MRKIAVCDFTLRALVQSGSDELLFREKNAVAACIDNIGADKIELPPVRKEKEDEIIYKTISALVKNSELAIPAGTDAHGIEIAWECVKNAVKPCLQIMLPVSTAQMEYGFRAKEPAMLEKIATLTALAKEKCDNIEFVALDASRADRDFLIKACLKAKECGAQTVTLCDDAGGLLPEEAAKFVADVKKECDLPIFVSLSDNLNMAVACAAYAIMAGADGVKTAMAGENVLLTQKFSDFIKVKANELGIFTSLKLTEIKRDITQTMKKISPDEKSARGGVSVSADAQGIFLDSQSTLADVCEAVKILGYDLTDEDNGKVHKALAQVCERKSSVGAKELEALIASYALQAPSTYHLLSFVANCSNPGSSMAQVSLQCGEDVLNGVATGDGPIDSAFRAIEQSIGYHYELDDFQIQAVTEGKEALGSALVRLRNRGKLYSGTGLSTDIVGASIRAYINALNKIVFEED